MDADSKAYEAELKEQMESSPAVFFLKSTRRTFWRRRRQPKQKRILTRRNS